MLSVNEISVKHLILGQSLKTQQMWKQTDMQQRSLEILTTRAWSSAEEFIRDDLGDIRIGVLTSWTKDVF